VNYRAPELQKSNILFWARERFPTSTVFSYLHREAEMQPP